MSHSETKSADDSIAAARAPENVQSTKGNGCRSKILVALILFVAVAGIGYVVQQLIKPNVDDTKIKPIVIGSIGSSDSADPIVDDVDPDIADLPPNAITRKINQKIIDAAEHPFDPLLVIAKESLAEIDRTIRDYESTMASQVFADGKLQGERYLAVKIRHRHTSDDGTEHPFAAYTLFLKPKSSVLETI